jgi:hypothetical protein
MHVGVLQVELLVRSSNSLKDKRRVVKSVKDRLHREHLCAVAEVDANEHHRLAVLGVSVVSSSAAHAATQLDAVADKLAHTRDAELGETSRLVATIDQLRPSEVDEHGDPKLPVGVAEALERDLLQRGAQAARDADASTGPERERGHA